MADTREGESSAPTARPVGSAAAASDDVGGGRLTVAVAVLTFRRPAEVVETVAMIVDQIPEVSSDYRVDVLVVDNDSSSTTTSLRSRFAETVRYVHEPEPGISAGRNRALAESGHADLLVFIDDDERPQPGWLARLLDTYSLTGAAAVAGAVVSAYDGPLDEWIRAGGFFERRRLPTGTPIETAATNNLLIDLRVIRRLDLRFDRGFGLSGGEDTMFTRSLVRSGARAVWCDEAVVVDMVPATRMTRAWVLSRAFRSGNSSSRVAVEMSRSRRDKMAVQLRCTALATPRIAGGLGRYAYGISTRSIRHQARGLRTAARGAGMATGAFGWVSSEYRRATTSTSNPAEPRPPLAGAGSTPS